MRIIAGKFKGRRLANFNADHIRPTTDRVKESLFNILASSIADAVILDLFAGTGNLSLEALSRGAKEATLVELHPLSVKIIRQNAQLLKVLDQIHIHRSDVIEFLVRYQGPSFNLIFADPPFPAKVALATLEKLTQSAACHQETIVVIEHSKHEPLPLQISGRPNGVGLLQYDQRRFGDKFLSFYRRA